MRLVLARLDCLCMASVCFTKLELLPTTISTSHLSQSQSMLFTALHLLYLGVDFIQDFCSLHVRIYKKFQVPKSNIQ